MKKLASWLRYLPISYQLGFSCLLLFLILTVPFFRILEQSEEKQLEYSLQKFQQALESQDLSVIDEFISANLASRFDRREMTDLLISMDLWPAPTWKTVHASSFRGKGHANVTFSDNKSVRWLRLDYRLNSASRWQLQNFCRIDRDAVKETRRFINALQSEEFERAFEFTVDYAYPKRKGVNFSRQSLPALREQLELNRNVELSFGNLFVPNDFTYTVPVHGEEKSFQIILHHRKYGKEGCELIVFDTQEISRHESSK